VYGTPPLLTCCSKSLKVPPTRTLYIRDVDNVSKLYCGVSLVEANQDCWNLVFELKLVEPRELLFVG
jgi:hypothetical protein